MAVLTEEQTLLRDAARTWVREKAPLSALRGLRNAADARPYDPAAYAEMAAMGWAGVIIPESHGGSAFGCQSLGLILEALGRNLVASPLIVTTLGVASAILMGGTAEQQSALLQGIAAGDLVGALAIDEGPHHRPEDVALPAVRTKDGWRLSGSKTFVLEGMAADVFLVSARTGGKPGDRDGISLFLVPADANGLSRSSMPLVDSRGAARLVLDQVDVDVDALLGPAGQGWALLDATLDRVRAGLAAEMLGSALQAFDTTLDYLKVRVQFGQPIGAFQALQHRAAKMYADLELTRSCVEAAFAAIDAGDANIAELVSLAKAKAGGTLHTVSNEMVQMHGGIGMTDAHDAGLYLKRARVAETALGGQAYHRDRYARLQGY